MFGGGSTENSALEQVLIPPVKNGGGGIGFALLSLSTVRYADLRLEQVLIPPEQLKAGFAG